MSDVKRWEVPGEVLAAHLQGEAVLLHMETKDYFRLNDTAAVVWKGLERGEGREALLARLCAEFEVDEAVAGAELDRLLEELARRGLIVEAGAS